MLRVNLNIGLVDLVLEKTYKEMIYEILLHGKEFKTIVK